ncbi:type II secretion system protein [bacterium]|nr:type II secretion system protein [bacterium]
MERSLMHLENTKSGFTLVELLVVMSIIIILVSIAVPAVNSARVKAHEAEVKAGVHDIHRALSAWSLDHNGFFPGMNWVFDSTGALANGPGIRGGTPEGDIEDQRFIVPLPSSTERYLPDGITPDPERIDVLVRDGYLERYPPNPFLRVGGPADRQMTNLFYFGVSEADGPDLFDADYCQWAYLSYLNGSTMRIDYQRFARGHFTYIPLNPVNTQGYDFVNDWASLNDMQRSEYYKYARSFLLIGWGATRNNREQGTGLSSRWWDSDLRGFDIDASMTLDPIETALPGIIWPHMIDSEGGDGGFGQVDITGHPNIDSGFFGATVILSSDN